MELTEKAQAAVATAKVTPFCLAPVFGDHMVLQRHQPVPVWGNAPAGSRVRITCNGQEKWAAVCAGRWMAQLDPMAPGTAFVLVAECHAVTDAAAWDGGVAGNAQPRPLARIECADVVVGDVYLAGGQSNMEYRMKESLDAKEWIARADLPMIRSFFAPRIPYVGAQADEPDAPFCQPPAWKVCSPETAPDFSAVAFHFARMLQADVDVPIGILDANWGGSSATCWLTEEDLESDPMLMPWVTEYRSLLETFDPAVYEAERTAYAAAVDAWVARDGEAVRKGMSASERETFVGGYPWPPPNGPKNALSPFGLYHTMLEPLAPYAVAGAAGGSGSVVSVRADAVPEPVAVRYGWANYTEANLFGGSGLPAAPFRMMDPAGGVGSSR